MRQLVYDENVSKVEEKELKDLFASKFGQYVRGLRKNKGLTQEELAHKANLHSTYIGHIETGTYTPSIFVVWKIAEVLKISLSEFFKNF